MAITTYGAETESILNHLDSNWQETDVAKPNAHYTPSADTPYVEVRFNNQTAFNAAVSASSSLVRHPGLLTLRVRVPLNLGDGLAVDHADTLAAIFRNTQVDGSIHFWAPTMRKRGKLDGWWVIDVDCPYYRDSIYS